MFDDRFLEELNFEAFSKIDKTFNICEYIDVESDGNEIKYIQKVVNICAEQGGGTVIVPRGEWKSGPIHLRSNVNLHIEKEAIINFTEDKSAYLPVVFTRWEGMECYNYSPFIYAYNCTNISVTGKGTLNGNGKSWWSWKKEQQIKANELCYAELNGIEVKDRVYGTEKDALRPSFIQPINCKNVLIEGVSVINSPQWNIHPVYCENVIIRDVRVISDGPNTDGLNPDSCKNVLIEDCFFSTGDDCIAINSGMNEDGWRVNMPCENILIRNCEMIQGHGAVVIGSGMSGGVKNIYAHNCKIKGGMQGIRLKSMRGRGGYIENVLFEDISIRNLSHEAVQINMFYEFTTVEPKSTTPADFRKIYIKNVSGNKNNAEAIRIVGLPEHKMEDIYLEDINIQSRLPIICKNIENLNMKNVNIKYSEGQENVFENIDNIELSNVKIEKY